MHTVAAQDEHFAGAQLKVPDIGRIDRPVADHSRRIVGGAPAWWTFTQPPISVVHRKKLRSDVICLGQSVDPTIADPCDQPSCKRCVGCSRERDGCGAGSLRATCDACAYVAVGGEKRLPDGFSIDAYVRQRAMEPCDELAARARSQCTASDAIGDDEQGAFGVERAAAILVHAMPRAARRSCRGV
jgi:hypothetical protein